MLGSSPPSSPSLFALTSRLLPLPSPFFFPLRLNRLSPLNGLLKSLLFSAVLFPIRLAPSLFLLLPFLLCNSVLFT